MARDPKAEIEISAHSRGLKARLREARAKFSTFAGELKKNVFGKDLVEKGFWSKAGASMMGNMGASAAGMIGSALVGQAKDVFAFEDSLTRLRIATGKTPEEMRAFAQSVRRTSDQVGIGAADILAGAHAYVALTGDMNGAAAMSKTFARVAQATNSQVGDIAKTAAALGQQMKIGPEEMEAMFSALAVQGKAGAIELKDLSTELSSIAPQWAQFAGGKGVKGVRELGAAMQIVKRGFGGDAGETTTGLQSFLVSVQQHSKQLKKAGVDVFTTNAKTGKKELKGVLDIVDGIANSKLANNPTKLVKALGRVEAYRAFIQLRDNRDELNRIIDVSTDAGAIQRDLDTYSQSAAGRTKIAWQKAKNEIAAAFTPERIEAFASALTKLAGVAATALSGVSKFLGGVEDFGTGLAMMIYGDTEDMKATKAQNAHRDSRVAQKLGLKPETESQRWYYDHMDITGDKRLKMRGATQEQIDAGRKAIALEDADAVAISQGRKLGRGSTGTYSMEQLVALSSMVKGKGYTNEAAIVAAIEARLKMLTDSQYNLAKVLEDFGKTTISIGADPVATAQRKAPQNARRPGA